MSEPDDPIRRAAALGPPSTTDAILFHVFAEWVAEKPKRLDRVLARARDSASIANVIALHGATGDAEWDASFRNAEIRLSSVAEMIRQQEPPPRPKRHKKR